MAVTVISGSSDSVVRTIPVGNRPRSMTFNPARGRVYVANQYSSTVSIIRDASGGIEEVPVAAVRAPNAGPTIVRGVLFLGGDCSRTGTVPRAVLLDISGRNVMDLVPGPNDVRRLASGVYFVRPEAGGVDGLRKIILQ
jgi:DNA-binding beta-propeller fold protein YncE